MFIYIDIYKNAKISRKLRIITGGMEKEECGMLLNKLEKKVPGNGLSLTIMYQI